MGGDLLLKKRFPECPTRLTIPIYFVYEHGKPRRATIIASLHSAIMVIKAATVIQEILTKRGEETFYTTKAWRNSTTRA